MFRTKIIIYCSLFIGVVTWGILRISPNDYLYYEELVKSSRPDQTDELISYTQHFREGVCKQIWVQDQTPLFFRIESDESELFFFHQNHHIEIVEQLDKVYCVMQEELYYLLPDGHEVTKLDASTTDAKPMQRMRYIEAQRACYNYTTQLFVAQEAKLWKYQLPGHHPPSTFSHLSPLMHGTAQCVEFTLKDKKLDFQAHRMRATFNQEEIDLL